jgi:molybdate transport system ATP-binding protein
MADELICRCRQRLRSGFQLDANLAIPLAQSPVTVLFGPSGSGKTTLLRLIAGLDRPDEGLILFRDSTWHDSSRGIHLPPQRRRAGFLFQDYALFPHMTVAANVAFAGNRERAAELMRSFGLSDMAARYPREISGGQQQRVALARALAAGSALLLLDEPLSALDAASRLRLRTELRRMLLASRVPAILVTHDRAEAIALGDWIAVMVEGRIRQTGPVQDVLRHPADALVAESVGVENVLPAEIVSRDPGLLTLQVGPQHLQCVDAGESGPLFACIHADDISLSRDTPHPSSVRNRLTGRVLSVVREGPLARVELDCGFPLVAVITAQSADDLKLKSGDMVCAAVKATAVHTA